MPRSTTARLSAYASVGSTSLARTHSDDRSPEELKKAVDAGDAHAAYVLGVKYFHGQGVPEDKIEAVRLFKVGHPQPPAQLVRCNLPKYVFRNAVLKLLRGLAQHPLPHCPFTATRLGVKVAAKKRHVEAMCNLGACLANGVGVAKDLVEAVGWLREAADQEDPVALCDLAVCYDTGVGVEKNPVAAAEYV